MSGLILVLLRGDFPGKRDQYGNTNENPTTLGKYFDFVCGEGQFCAPEPVRNQGRQVSFPSEFVLSVYSSLIDVSQAR